MIKDVYNVNFTEKDILGWIQGLYRLFDLAEGSFPAFARNSKLNTVLYRNYTDIDQEEILNLKKPKDRIENFLKIETVNFIEKYYFLFQYAQHIMEVKNCKNLHRIFHQ